MSAWDSGLFYIINGTLRFDLLDHLMPWLTDKWNFLPVLGGLSLYAVIGHRKRGLLFLMFAALVVGFSDAGATLLKGFFERERPCNVLSDVHLLVNCSESFS